MQARSLAPVALAVMMLAGLPWPGAAQAPNQAPTAEAGLHQTYRGPLAGMANTEAPAVGDGYLVRLDGTGSSDPEGDRLTYAWSQIRGPPVMLSSTTSSRPTFTAPKVLDDYRYNCDQVPPPLPNPLPQNNICLTFRLTVSDGFLTALDDVEIMVNGRPRADAGPDQTVSELTFNAGSGTIGYTLVTLNGCESRDPLDADLDVNPDLSCVTDGVPHPPLVEELAYRWEQLSGPPVALDSTSNEVVTFLAPPAENGQPVAVEFGLVVRDGDFSITGTPDVGNLDSVQDKVKVTVMPFLQPPTVTTLTVNPADVNIAGSPVQVAITVTATDDKQVQAVIAYVTATKLGTVLQVPLVHVTGDTYQGFLDSSNPRLTLNRDPFTGVVSPWSVSAFAFDADGGFGFVTDGTLTVRASGSATLPAVRLVGSGPAPLQNACFITPSSAPVQFLGPGDTIFLDVCMKPLQLLSRVTYQERFNQGHGGVVAGQEVDLPGPYAIPVDSLAGGEQTIRVKVYDRLGFTSFLDIPAVVDFGSPEVFIVAPNPTYQNVSFPFVVFIHDDTPKEVRVVLDGKVHILDTDNLAHAANITFLPEVDEDTGAFAATYLADLFGVELLDILESGADENHTLLHFLKDGDTYAFEFHLKRTVLGSATYTYEVRDIPGNRVTGAGSLLTINATTDIAVKNAYVVQTRLLPGDNATVRAVVRQKVGVTTVPVAVFFGADDMEEIVFGEAPVGQDIQIEFNRTFRPGIHELLVAAFAPPEVNETFEDDNLFEAEFEVFLGKTVKGEEEFYIRADERGLPDVAVMYLASTEKTFDLTLNQTGDVRYDFTAFGRSYYWDPLERNQTGKPVTTIPIEKTVKEKNQPLPFAVPLAAIAVAAALLRRRR